MKPKAKTPTPTSGYYSENRQWANTKEKPKPLDIPTPYRPPERPAIDQEQLDQAIQKALLRALENAGSDSEQVDQADEKPKTKKKQTSDTKTKAKPKAKKAGDKSKTKPKDEPKK